MKKDKFDPTIDPHNLDEEWVGQPKMYYQYAAELADAKQDLGEAKSDMEVVRAELDLKIRRDPDAYDIPKVTESIISSTIATQKEYQEAQDQVIVSKHRVDILEAAVSSLDHRKTALVKLVDLHLSSYYSSPRASGGTKEAMDEVEKKAVRRKCRTR